MSTNGLTTANGTKTQNLAAFIWSVADLLRGDFRPAQYGRVMLPFTVLRRIDCVLEATKPAVLKLAGAVKDVEDPNPGDMLRLQKASGFKFYNMSRFNLSDLPNESGNLSANLENYLGGFSKNIRDIFERYEFNRQIASLHEKDLLLKVLQSFLSTKLDLHPNVVSNADMGMIFEHLIRKFNELSNETAGDHYTPRDAIRLMVDLVLHGDTDLLQNKAPLRTIYDPTAGTGGMLSIAEERIKAYKANAQIKPFAQEINDESYAICKADMLIKGEDIANIVLGDTLTDDAFPNHTFDYMFSNPPYGVDWKKIESKVRAEQARGNKGRFAPGLPRVSDGQTLFLLHLVSKMRPLKDAANGSRIGIVMNGSPLFSGGAGSGESEIRRHVIENDWLEAIVALPTDMFYNTGISTYVWILTNNKSAERRGKVQLINGTQFYQKMRKSLGSKRRELAEEDIAKIVEIHGAFEEGEHSKILPNDAFGYRTITVERPLRLAFEVTPQLIDILVGQVLLKKNSDYELLREPLLKLVGRKYMSRTEFLKALDKVLKGASISLKLAEYKTLWQTFSSRDAEAQICATAKSEPEPDADLRDTENVPLGEDITAYFEREVRPFMPDAWIDESKTKMGYEIPFTRYFYKYVSPRTLEAIDYDLQAVTQEIISMLDEVTA